MSDLLFNYPVTLGGYNLIGVKNLSALDSKQNVVDPTPDQEVILASFGWFYANNGLIPYYSEAG